MSTAVFISYARADDEDFVRRLHQDLTKHGISVWWDREAMESRGRTFLQELRDAIEASDRVIAVIGIHAARSSYVKVEWEHALLFCKGVLPILRQGDHDLVPPDLAKLHCIDFRKERAHEEALSELLDKLAQPVLPLGPFRTAVPALPPHFEPRREQLESLAATVLADVRRPVVVTSARQTSALRGMGGVGKSVLAAALARSTETRRAFGDGVIWLTLGREPNLLHSLRLVGLAFDDDLNNYTNPEAAASCLSRLLADKVCLIVLDDLWDVAHLSPFRDALGPRCRLLFTSRDAGLVAAAGAVECHLTVLSREASLRLLAQWCETEPQSLPPQAVDIVDECGDLPLAIAMVGAMLRGREGRWDNVLHKLRGADLDKIARQFPNYPYPNLFRAIEVSVEALQDTDRQRYLDFAVFPEHYPLPEGAFQTLWSGEGLDEYDTQDLLHTLVDRALAERDAQGCVTLHALQFDFVRNQTADLPALHRHLLSAYRSQAHGADWQDIEDDGYIYNRLTWHLEMAGLSEDIHALLAAETRERQCAWWVARERRAQTAEFLSDVARAWRLADEELGKLDDKSDRSLMLQRQTLYALVESVLASLAANLPCELLAAALEQDVFTLSQALAHARQNADPLERVKALIILLPHVPDGERVRALAEAMSGSRQIDDPLNRIRAFSMVAPHLPEPERDTLLAEALRLAKGSDQFRPWPDPDNYLREGALEVLAPHLPGGLFPEALEVARCIWLDDGTKQKAIAHLAPYLPQALSDELIGLARAVQYESNRAATLIPCIEHLPAAKHPSVLGEAIQAALKYEDSECLSALAPHIPAELLPTVLDAALGIREEIGRAHALAAICPALGHEQRRQVVEAVLGFENQVMRAWALCALAPFLADGEQSRIVAEALSAARGHLEGYDLAAVLAELAPYLPAVELPATLAGASAISDPGASIMALLALHDVLPEIEREGVLREALDAARDIEYIGSRLQVLSAIATRQPPAQAMETWREALAVAGDLGPYFNDEELRIVYQQIPEALFPEALERLSASHNALFRHRALAELSLRLDPDLLRMAIVIARGIGDTTSRVGALTLLLPYVATADGNDRTQEVLALANEIQDPEEHVHALTRLLRHLSPIEQEHVCRKALEAIRDLKRLSGREQALTALAPALPDALLAEAMKIARELPPSDGRVRAVMALSSRLVPEEQLSVLRAELQAAQSIADGSARSEAFAQFLDHSPESFVMEVINAARDKPSDERSTEWLLKKAVPRLKEPDRSEVVKEAWIAAVRGESPPYHLDSSDFVQWMCGLAPHLSPEQLNDTLSTARQIDTPAERARALIRLSACLAEPEAVALLDEAVSACGAMPETATRTVILAELAARLSPERRGELLAQARQLDDARQRVAALTNLAAHLPKADGVSALYDAITCLPQLAEEKERAAAFQRLTPLLSLELVREALKTAAAMVDPQKRAEAMKALAARLPESERAEALRAVLLAALRITWRPARCTILKELVATTVPADRLIPVWIDVLHAAAAQPRSDLVAELADLAPLMSKVAGARAADSVFTAIETVGRWWP